MTRGTTVRNAGHAGFVLPATVIFTFIVMIATLGFSSMVSYETRAALNRQATVESFYLADGAVERARARLMNDGDWRGTLSGVPEGDGTYDLAVSDTTLPVIGPAVKIVGTGHVGATDRRVELWAQVESSALEYALFVGGDAEVSGNFCLTGTALVVGDASGSSPAQPPLFTCGGTYREFVTETPPRAYTIPDSFPGATYYSVRGNSTSPARARIYNRLGQDITGATDLSDVLTFGGSTFAFAFDTDAKIGKYFDPTTGIFALGAHDAYVVVDFGEAPTVSPPGANGVARLLFDGHNPPHGTMPQITATVINTRFVGTTEAQRLDPAYWRGSTVEYQECQLSPVNGLALIGRTLDCPTGNGAELGTSAHPALLYVTGAVSQLGSNLEVIGCLTTLGDFHSHGGPAITSNPGFVTDLPAFLKRGGSSGGSGTVHVVRWREVTAPA
jgi:hypothetical protein